MSSSESSVTLQAIADACGVTKGAVSLALRGKPGVSRATRKHVEETARRLGYRPDPGVSALAQRRWRHSSRKPVINLALVTAANSEFGEDSPEFQFFADNADRLGYGLSLIRLRSGDTARDLNRQLRALVVQGVLLNRFEKPPFSEAEWWKEVKWDLCAWVAFNEAMLAPPTHRVLDNTFSNTQNTLQRMADRGYHRVAFLKQTDALSRENARQHGAFLQYAATHAKERASVFEIPARIQPDSPVWDAVRKFSPEALLLGYTGLWMVVPKDLSTLPWASLAVWEHRLKGVGEPGVPSAAGNLLSLEERATAAIDMLDFQIRRQDYGLPARRHTMLVDGRWIEGDSLPRKPG